MSPRVTESSPASTCMSVDLPEPDGPMIAVKAPLATSRLTPRSATTCASADPYTFHTSTARTTVRGGATTVVVMVPIVQGAAAVAVHPRAEPNADFVVGAKPEAGSGLTPSRPRLVVAILIRRRWRAARPGGRPG